ncbi:hypothetical protein JNUCC31_09020 [Paenibacillus sp. JNUCC31]|uniref:hypothetical protein n=1 Tax=Paenibacillus sp. JNUCC-31 TaxID=2777983 RepID=UPI00178300D0|nr:hypothetical protein [Paenibacillus sp. JNUCC-31]QOS80990.1 hypothetical protein JNUCC31_09020 [Paenibacillus sp. JNUCC-31]
MKLPQTVQTAITAYQEEKAKVGKAVELHQDSSAKYRQQLEDAHSELAVAQNTTLTDPSEANVQREADLQRKIAELTVNVAAAEERSTTVSINASGRITALADEAIELARVEALRHFHDNYDAKLKAIEDAKYEYLQSIVNLHALRKEAYNIWFNTGQETNPNRLEKSVKPAFPELTLHYRGGSRQVHGVSELETARAYRDGKVYRTSVAEGREIE